MPRKIMASGFFKLAFKFIFRVLKRISYKEERLKRSNRVSVMLNNREARALGIYCSRYRITNKSEFLRETLMKAILKRFDDEHPSLWEEPEPTLFSRQ